MVRMCIIKRIVTLFVFVYIASSVQGSLCSSENRATDLPTCIDKIREAMFSPDTFWFGKDYTMKCPNNEASGPFCVNPKPSAQSIHVRLFPNTDFTSGLDRFLELEFHSEGKNYNACGNAYKTAESWVYNADPLSDTVVYPWYVKNFPFSVKWNYTVGDYYTLMVYDAGFMTSNGLYINIQNDDITTAEIIRHYGQPLIGTDIKNPYVFLLLKQNGTVTLSNEWRDKFTTGNVAGAWTIKEFMAAVNIGNEGLVAANWIVVSGDEWVAQKMLDVKGPYALCPLYATKALLEKTRTFVPSNTQLSVWIDFEFMMNVSITIDVCCKKTTYTMRNFTLNPIGNEHINTFDVRSETPHILTFSKLGYYSERHNFTGEKYTIIAVDPDVPEPAVGTEDRPILHGIITNIPNGNLKEGDKGMSWAGPYPPNDVPHYYYTLLYKQQSDINATALRYDYAGNCTGRLAGRCLYNINLAVSENNLTLVGATWFTSQRDPYVLFRQLNSGSAKAEVCKDQPGYKDPCTISSATLILPSFLTACTLFLFSTFSKICLK